MTFRSVIFAKSIVNMCLHVGYFKVTIRPSTITFMRSKEYNIIINYAKKIELCNVNIHKPRLYLSDNVNYLNIFYIII